MSSSPSAHSGILTTPPLAPPLLRSNSASSAPLLPNSPGHTPQLGRSPKSIGRVLLRPITATTRAINLPSISLPNAISIPLRDALSRLEISFSIPLTFRRLRAFYAHQSPKYPHPSAAAYVVFSPMVTTIEHTVLAVIALWCLWCITAFGVLFKLAIVGLYLLAVLIPFTSQFFLPATPILSWVLLFFSAKFIAPVLQPHIWVSVLPTLETTLYGANISDILTRYNTNPFLDLLAWFPYGVTHYVGPFVVAACLFIFAQPPGAVKFFAKAFGYMNLLGVLIQVFIPCSPPWYELVHGLTPADFSMPGHPGGLARIDRIFHSNTYTAAFTASPLPFGAFPSLHAGCSTIEALFLTHFFPAGAPFWWTYVALLYWATMHLSHHYMIDLTAGGSLACLSFFYFLSLDPKMRFLRHEPSVTSKAHNSTSRGDNEDSEESEDGGGYGFSEAGSSRSQYGRSRGMAHDARLPDSASPFLERHGAGWGDASWGDDDDDHVTSGRQSPTDALEQGKSKPPKVVIN